MRQIQYGYCIHAPRDPTLWFVYLSRGSVLEMISERPTADACNIQYMYLYNKLHTRHNCLTICLSCGPLPCYPACMDCMPNSRRIALQSDTNYCRVYRCVSWTGRPYYRVVIWVGFMFIGIRASWGDVKRNAPSRSNKLVQPLNFPLRILLLGVSDLIWGFYTYTTSNHYIVYG